MTKVLHVAQGAHQGGAERAIKSIIDACRPCGIESHVAAPQGPFDFGVKTFALEPLRRSLVRLPAAYASLRAAINASRPDLIHFHSIGYFVAHQLFGRYHAPHYLLGLHGLPEDQYLRVAPFLKWRAKPVIAYGAGTSRILGKLRIRHDLILYPLDPPPEPASRATLRSLGGIPESAVIVLSVGRLVDQKNHAVLIRALPSAPAVHLVIAGEGPLKSRLADSAAALGVTDRLTLAGFRDDVRSLMAAADAVAMPSHWEGFGLAAAEAMAAGTPVLAADSAGLREWILDGRTGRLLPPDDPAAWADAFRRLRTHAPEWETITVLARDAMQQLTPQNVAAGHARIYARIINPTAEAE